MSNLTERLKERKLAKQTGEFEYRLQEPVEAAGLNEPDYVAEREAYLQALALADYQAQQRNLAAQQAAQQDPTSGLLEFVKYSAEPPDGDPLLRHVHIEREDILAKLDIIEFLKGMEKALRKRLKVLNALEGKIQESWDDLAEVGADSIDTLSGEEIQEVKQYIAATESVDKTPEVVDNVKSGKKGGKQNRLSDFDVEE